MTDRITTLAADVVRWCRTLAVCSEQDGATTRTFLCEPMRTVEAQLAGWMSRLGMSVSIDAVGNLRGLYPAHPSALTARRLLIGSHLDTVPNAGAFDGVLGVVLAIALVELANGERFPFELEVVGFSEEEGVRFGLPFIGSRALVGRLDDTVLDRLDAAGTSVRDAITAYGLAVDQVAAARETADAIGYLEFHIEQGPVLDSIDLPVGVVTAIAGQTRLAVTFTGTAAHAGTTPMKHRRDALAATAEWIGAVEHDALTHEGLVATVGRVEVEPGAANVVPGRCRAPLDVRHVTDAERLSAVRRLTERAHHAAGRRHINVEVATVHDQPSVMMDAALSRVLEESVRACGLGARSLASGAGHDAMIMAEAMPAAMLMIRSPGGISHHPDENVREEDVAAALAVGRAALDAIARSAG